ncbi:hypothetical protein LG634_09495 [Streptomyces bambusae]|uniref:hypothetical protein n=1 Tax=Streptomyces bambusae TaxID=1550616 RepID=UPI001CFEFBFD|nr:hypothetical protein [Streptomyces bambusae]MCB5165061.1 hypothetical protein [Streptomyces bambusae]
MVDDGAAALRAAVDEARRLASAGRLGEARSAARQALDVYGADAELFLLLAWTHVAENDDDHDDLAEQVYREGLEAFPDRLDLLTVYAELCLKANFADRPARHGRGPVLAAKVAELAPGSPYAQRLERVAARPWLPGSGDEQEPGPARMQRLDLRTALLAAPLPQAAERARAEAGRWPGDLRRRVLAESLTALERPGRRLLVLWSRHLFPAALGHAVLLSAVIWGAAVLERFWPVPLAVLVSAVPRVLLDFLLVRARRRAGEAVAGPELPERPALPPHAQPASRDWAALWSAALLLLCSVTGAGVLWSEEPPSGRPSGATVVAPTTFRGLPAGPDAFFGGDVASTVSGIAGEDAVPFGRTWAEESLSGPEGVQGFVTVAGAFGDMREVSGRAFPSVADRFRRGMEPSGMVGQRTWRPAAGAGGSGRVECGTYGMPGVPVPVAASCTWADADSIGTVLVFGSGLAGDIEAVTRELRAATVLRRP